MASSGATSTPRLPLSSVRATHSPRGWLAGLVPGHGRHAATSSRVPDHASWPVSTIANSPAVSCISSSASNVRTIRPTLPRASSQRAESR